MDESVFQPIHNGDVATALLILAIAAAAVGVVVGIVKGLGRRHLLWWNLVGLLAGATGFLILGGWHLVVARTCFHDRLYAGQRPRRMFRLPLPSAERYEARERARYSPSDPLFRDGRPQGSPDAPGGRLWLPADRLDSVGNLVLLGVLFALGGLGVGLAWGHLLRGLRRAEGNGT